MSFTGSVHDTSYGFLQHLVILHYHTTGVATQHFLCITMPAIYKMETYTYFTNWKDWKIWKIRSFIIIWLSINSWTFKYYNSYMLFKLLITLNRKKKLKNKCVLLVPKFIWSTETHNEIKNLIGCSCSHCWFSDLYTTQLRAFAIHWCRLVWLLATLQTFHPYFSWLSSGAVRWVVGLTCDST